MRKKLAVLCALAVLFAVPMNAFFEDICIPRKGQKGPLSWCINPNCLSPVNTPNRVCPQQALDFFTVQPGRSMIHADSTYFIAQALGYRADVAYWIAAYNEVTDYGLYNPIDQCGKQAASSNSGKNYMAAAFDGFRRTNTNTDGPLDHYTASYSPNGQGTDVHGAGGVQAVYPLHYPIPGYPEHIDDTYQKTLANLRGWGMLATDDPGILCTVGMTSSSTQSGCLEATISGTVPFLRVSQKIGVPISVAAGRKVLNFGNGTTVDYYDKLQAYLDDPSKTTGTLWMSPTPGPVPVQLARLGLYLHVLQDTSSHATYCGDDAPSTPGGIDPGTYMYLDANNNVKFLFGTGCANSAHLAGHLQETGTGASALPLRDYVALNNTVDELILFGNSVALQNGWIANRELLPPDLAGGKSAQGMSAADLKENLVGKIVGGTPAYTRGEIYQSGIITLQLQQTDAMTRLNSLNGALGAYGDAVRARSANPSAFVPFQPMPGNSFTAGDQSVCWK